MTNKLVELEQHQHTTQTKHQPLLLLVMQLLAQEHVKHIDTSTINLVNHSLL
jgi:hypothetical protein